MKENILPRGWKLSFELNPVGEVGGFSSIIHATINGNIGAAGERIPAVWFISNTRKMHITSDIGDNTNYVYNTNFNLPRDRFMLPSTEISEQLANESRLFGSSRTQEKCISLQTSVIIPTMFITQISIFHETDSVQLSSNKYRKLICRTITKLSSMVNWSIVYSTINPKYSRTWNTMALTHGTIQPKQWFATSIWRNISIEV